MSLLELPAEIRLNIYRLTFGQGKALMSADCRGDISSLISASARLESNIERSSQLLRTCRTVLSEARHILYANTVFHIIVAQAFAGRIPSTFSNGHIAAPYIQNLVWQLDCDMMKHFYADDLRLDPASFSELETLELRVRADTWRNSFLGEWCDREAFVKGREQTLAYAATLKDMMVKGREGTVTLVEDRSHLGRGRVIMRISRGRTVMRNEVSPDSVRPRR